MFKDLVFEKHRKISFCTRRSSSRNIEKSRFAHVARKTIRQEDRDFHFNDEQKIILKMLSMKYLLMMRVFERVADLKCLTSRDFYNLDRRSLRAIYKIVESY